MWNKLFKKKQSKPSNKSQNEATSPPTKCFSFRNGRKPSGDHYQLNHFLQYESEIYKKPGEALSLSAF